MAPTPSEQTPELPRIEAINIAGNRRISSDTIRFNLLSREGDLLNPAVVASDVRSLYALQYFDYIQVNEEQGEAGVIVTFVFQETPVIRRIDYEGQSFVKVTDILLRLREQNVGLSLGQAHDPERVERARNVIVDLLVERGRQEPSVGVEVYGIVPRAVGVTFHIDEGTP